MGLGGVAIAILPSIICLKLTFSDGLGGGKKGKYSVRHLRFQSSLFNVALEMAFLIFATFSLAKA